MNSTILRSGRLKIKTIILISTCLVLTISIGMLGFLVEATAASIPEYEACIDNTIDEPQCKDCCDCIPDPELRQACRDTCAENDFSDNTDCIVVDAPSILGPDGD